MKVELFDRPIAFHRCLADWTGDVKCALLLSQILYWNNRTDNPDGWFYKTAEDFEKETSLTRREQEKVRKHLTNIDFIEEVRKGVPAKLYFRLSRGFYEKMSQSMSVSIPEEFQMSPKGESRCPQRANLDVLRREVLTSPKGESITEITTKTNTVLKNKEKGLFDLPDMNDTLINKWNHIALECKLPGITKRNSPTRTSHLSARLKEHPDLSTWEILFANILKMKPLALAGELSWFSFDWVIKSNQNFDKVMANWMLWRLNKTKGPANHAPEECRPTRKFESVTV